MESPENRESKPEILLEPATENDVGAYVELEKSVAGTRTYSAMTTEEEAREQIAKYSTFLIKQGQDAIGSVSYQMKGPDHAYIDGLVVKPEYQGKGVGREAMVKLLSELKDVKTIDLVTHPENTRAISLYESLGFKIGEEKENYFGDGEPRLVMTLERP